MWTEKKDQKLINLDHLISIEIQPEMKEFYLNQTPTNTKLSIG